MVAEESKDLLEDSLRDLPLEEADHFQEHTLEQAPSLEEPTISISIPPHKNQVDLTNLSDKISEAAEEVEATPIRETPTPGREAQMCQGFDMDPCVNFGCEDSPPKDTLQSDHFKVKDWGQ